MISRNSIDYFISNFGEKLDPAVAKSDNDGIRTADYPVWHSIDGIEDIRVSFEATAGKRADVGCQPGQIPWIKQFDDKYEKSDLKFLFQSNPHFILYFRCKLSFFRWNLTRFSKQTWITLKDLKFHIVLPILDWSVFHFHLNWEQYRRTQRNVDKLIFIIATFEMIQWLLCVFLFIPTHFYSFSIHSLLTA
jgi:hypothetical protein